MKTVDIKLRCEKVTTSMYTEDMQVELTGVNCEELVALAIEVADPDYIAYRIMLEHLEEAKKAMKELEDDNKYMEEL